MQFNGSFGLMGKRKSHFPRMLMPKAVPVGILGIELSVSLKDVWGYQTT
jgi:hypothetical protein